MTARATRWRRWHGTNASRYRRQSPSVGRGVGMLVDDAALFALRASQPRRGNPSAGERSSQTSSRRQRVPGRARVAISPSSAQRAMAAGGRSAHSRAHCVLRVGWKLALIRTVGPSPLGSRAADPKSGARCQRRASLRSPGQRCRTTGDSSPHCSSTVATTRSRSASVRISGIQVSQTPSLAKG